MLKAYASYFASYLLDNVKNVDNIERIVLFGSVARGEDNKDSDVDIFIELKKDTIKSKIEIKSSAEKFYQSREALLFKTKGIENKISLKIGKLKGWKDLYRSVASTGIVLYGPYEAKTLPSGAKHFIIVYWDKVGKNRGAFLNKVYGVKIKNKKYEGLITKFGGKKTGKSSIMIPVQYKKEIFKLLKPHEVRPKVLEVFS